MPTVIQTGGRHSDKIRPLKHDNKPNCTKTQVPHQDNVPITQAGQTGTRGQSPKVLTVRRLACQKEMEREKKRKKKEDFDFSVIVSTRLSFLIFGLHER
jgi:hypothetical protein